MTDNQFEIHGYVTCDKQPIENVTVNVINHTDTSNASVQTDKDGKYHLDLTNVLDEDELAFVEVYTKNYLFRANSYLTPKRIDVDITDIVPEDVNTVTIVVDEI